MRQLLFILCFILLSVNANATHIIGGTLTYKQLGTNSYEITLRLFRDCLVGNAPFPSSVLLHIRDVNGNPFSPTKDVNVSLGSTLPVASYLPCMTNPGICVEEGIYTIVRNNMPPQTGGYHVYVDYCCRNGAISNLLNQLSYGMSCYTFIPDPAVAAVNTSPDWNIQPPLFNCQGAPMNYDYGATDADGDSLVYRYYTPFTDNAPTFPGGIATFSPVQWGSGYADTNACGGAVLTMNPQTGFISGTPANIGQFVIGVCCTEYRNGQAINSIYREYMHHVITCQPYPAAAFLGTTITCLGNSVQFVDNSSGAFSYDWDFGDTATTADTSHLQNPAWLYSSPGTYTVTLIINRNTACADTANFTIVVEAVYPQFTMSSPVFTGQPVSFTDASYTSTGSPIVLWSWDFGDNSPLSSQQSPTHIYNTPGNYTVQLTVISANGCQATYFDTVIVNLFNGLRELAEEPFRIWPNPSDGHLWLYFAETGPVKVAVTDITGRLIQEIMPVNSGTSAIDLSVSPGIYFIRYTGSGASITRKVEIYR